MTQLVLLSLWFGCAGDRTSQHREAIVNGQPTAGAPAVVAIGLPGTSCGTGLNVLCSGTLIAPRVVLTAAHCIEGISTEATLEVFFGEDTSGSGTYIDTVELSRHPSYVPDNDQFDIALLRLAQDAPVAPQALPTVPLDTALVGTTIRVVGFGAVVAAGTPDGIKRQGEAVVTQLNAATFDYEPGPSMTCFGDSGGPALVREGTIDVVAGVTSRGDPACQSYGTDTRVYPYLADYVMPFVNASAPARDAPTIAPNEICSSECVRRDDCPRGLDCRESLDGRRCVRANLPPGDFGEPCEPDLGDPCTQCVRIAVAGQCRQYQPCEPNIVMTPPECQANDGCASQREPSPPLFGAMLLVALALWLCCRRTTRRQPRDI